MKKIVREYRVVIYDDGSADIVPVTERLTILANCSASIRQIVGVIEYVLEERKKERKNIHYHVTAGVNKVAAEEEISNSAVHTKILRKLNLSMADFKEMLNKCIENRAPEDDEFVEILRKACEKRSKKGDRDAVESLIKKIRELE